MALGVFLAPECVKAVQKSSVWFSPLWPSSAPPAVWTAFTHSGARKGPKATYFHPRTHPEGYPGCFGVFRGTSWNLEPCFKKGARTWYPPKVPSPGQKKFFFEFVYFWAQKVLFRVETESGGVFWGVWVGEYGQNDIESFFFQKSKKSCLPRAFATPYPPPPPFFFLILIKLGLKSQCRISDSVAHE